jgi:hypothetical protein
VQVNGIFVGRLAPDRDQPEIHVPAQALKSGRNLLGFRLIKRPRVGDPKHLRQIDRDGVTGGRWIGAAAGQQQQYGGEPGTVSEHDGGH